MELPQALANRFEKDLFIDIIELSNLEFDEVIEYVLWNSMRFLLISPREATSEGLDKDGFKGFGGLNQFVGFLRENGEVDFCYCCCCCMSIA